MTADRDVEAMVPVLHDLAALDRVARDVVRRIHGTVTNASPDAPCPRGRDDPTGRRHRR
jgi:hypothetical protein